MTHSYIKFTLHIKYFDKLLFKKYSQTYFINILTESIYEYINNSLLNMSIVDKLFQ